MTFTSRLPVAYIQEGVNAQSRLAPWYHRFQIETDNEAIEIHGWEGIYPVWDKIREVRGQIDYRGKRVLDQGTRDGMWAFEAEQLGARTVIGTDIGDDGYREHAGFIKAVIESKVGFYFNAPTEQVFDRLDTFFQMNHGLFDIVQHLGLLYHLEDPLRSLRETRRCMNKGGTLLLETAYWQGGDKPGALFNSRGDVYSDKTTHWAFNNSGLVDALQLCGFGNISDSRVLNQNETIGRVCLIVQAT